MSIIEQVAADPQRIIDILTNSGVSQEGIQWVMSNPGIARLVERNAGLGSFFAQRFPSAGTSQYYAAEAELGFTEQMVSVATNPAMADAAASSGTMLTNEAMGAVRLKNGVIIQTDPSTGQQQILYPPGDSSVAGSPTWVRESKNWSADKRKKWAKRLEKRGYIEDASAVGLSELQKALSDFHWNKYLGNPHPTDGLDGAGGGRAVAPDKSEVRNAIRVQFRNTFGDDPTDDELRDWQRFIVQTSLQLQRKKGYTPEYAATAAEERFIEDFEAQPDVAWARDHNQDIAENTELRDRIVGLAQAIGGRT